MILETTTLIFPHTDTPKTVFVTPYVVNLKQAFAKTGKMIHESTIYSSDGLRRITTRIWKNQESLDEWNADPYVEARFYLYKDLYDRTNVSYKTTVESLSV